MTATTLNPRASTVRLSSALTAGLVAGIAGAVLANLYYALYMSFTGTTFPELSLVSITFASLLPSVLGALVYYGFVRFTRRAQALFVTLGLTLAVLSTLPQFVQPLHPGFAWASAPLHLIVGLTAVILIPRLARS